MAITCDKSVLPLFEIFPRHLPQGNGERHGSVSRDTRRFGQDSNWEHLEHNSEALQFDSLCWVSVFIFVDVGSFNEGKQFYLSD